MIQCPVCRRRLNPFGAHPHAPICSEACRREALRRVGAVDASAQPDAAASQDRPAQFEQLTATHLYCRTCQGSMPVRERLLLMLPDGNLYGYTCVHCQSDVGTKTERR